MNVLKMEKRGCDFFEKRLYDVSDIGNYRITTAGKIPWRDGREMFLEISRWDKYIWRTTYKKDPTKELLKPVRECVARNVAYIANEFDNERGSWRDTKLERDMNEEPVPYTSQGVLDAVNRYAAVHYDAIEFV